MIDFKNLKSDIIRQGTSFFKSANKRSPGLNPVRKTNISDIKSNFTNFLRPNLYRVYITAPFSSGIDESIFFLCKNAAFPFHTINTEKFFYNNINYNFAQSIDYDPINLVFTLDNNNKVFSFFDEWNGIIKNDNRQIGYKSDYAGQIDIEVVDNKNRIRMIAFLFGAFPVNMEDIQLSYEEKDTLMNLSVNFIFDDIVYITDNSLSPGEGYREGETLGEIAAKKDIFAPIRSKFEAVLGTKITHQLENKAKNIFRTEIAKKTGRNVLHGAEDVFRTVRSGTVKKTINEKVAKEIFKF